MLIHCQVCNQSKPWGRTQHWVSGETVYLCVDCDRNLQEQANYRHRPALEATPRIVGMREAYQRYADVVWLDGAGAYPNLI